jgi:hypothetical protein
MKSKVFVMVMTVVLSCSLLALAQKKNDTPTRQQPQQNPQLPMMQKVMLSCAPGQGKDVSTPLYVKNPTGQDLPAGTIVSWSATSGGTATGKQTLTEALKKNSGNQVSLLGPAGNVGSCQAWTTKK